MKAFDCIQMKREAQEQIYRDTKGMSREEELTYFHRAAEEFRQEMRARKRAAGKGTSRVGKAKRNPAS